MLREKMIEGILALNVDSPENEGMLEELHELENALMHQKLLNQLVMKVSPVLVNIIKEGIEKGCFHTEQPEELGEFFLTSALVIMDQGISNFTQEKQAKMRGMIIYALEVLLGVERGTFEEIIERKM